MPRRSCIRVSPAAYVLNWPCNWRDVLKIRNLSCPARFLVALLFATVYLVSASAQSDAPPKPAPAAKPRAVAPGATMAIPDIPYTKFVLANGLTVLVHEDHKAPIVAVNTWYHVASKNERLGKTGFAHLLEHH